MSLIRGKWSGQWLENFDQTHLVLASGKPVQQKISEHTVTPFFPGENATIVCKVGSVPKSAVRWYRDGNEVLNNSLSNRGLQRFLIFENGTFEGQSSLVLTNVKTDDSGQYKCVASNPAGKVEANFTLQVDPFIL